MKKTMKRTTYCGRFTEEAIGRTVTAMGWVWAKRDMGGVLFLDLRDREGTLQVVCDAKHLPPIHFAEGEAVKNHWVIAVTGTLRLRGEDTYNPKIPTGTIELLATSLEVLSKAAPLPFPLDASALHEELRMEYKYLDLRRPSTYQALAFRHRITRAIEAYLDGAGFISVETPILTKSTPEGARDYLVPSRVHPGAFYALPQSPQLFKQLLMVGGIDRYYQIARCFRDEDLRADRQPEFTQVDVEMSFVDVEDVLGEMEGLLCHLFEKEMETRLPRPFPRLTWQQAMDSYGSDKPDLRFDMLIVDVTDIAAESDFSVFTKVAASGGIVRAVNCKGGAEVFTRGAIDGFTARACALGAKGMAWILIGRDGQVNSILPKYFGEEGFDTLLHRLDGAPGDFIFFCADTFPLVCRVLGTLRNEAADIMDLRKKDDFALAFITDFPLLQYNEEEGRYESVHHPFTMPRQEDMATLAKAPEKVLAQAYDVVLNGVELGGGSIRIHRPQVQRKVFAALGFSPEEAEERFGFMLKALSFGTPPHGGFALGLDRLVMLLLGTPSLRDVIAFPKTKEGTCLMTSAPGYVDDSQLEVLHLRGETTAEELKKNSDPIEASIPVEKVASLAMLGLSEEKSRSTEGDMGRIIAFANALSTASLDNARGDASLLPQENVFREDTLSPSAPRDSLLANAPSATEGCFTVAQVLGGEEETL